MGDEFIIRTSDRLTFKQCRRKWDLGSKLRQNYRPKFTPQVLDFGIAIHRGLEAYYEPSLWEEPELRLSATLGAFTRSCNEQRDLYFKLTEELGLDPEKERDFDAELTLGVGMLRHYAEWAPEQDKWFRPVKVEIEFQVPVALQSILAFYEGRVELLVVDENGHYWIIDHKTAGQFSGTEWLEFDEQGGSYCWALSLMLGLPIRGVIYNRLLKDIPVAPEPMKAT